MDSIVGILRAWVPDPLAVALGLTVAAFVAALIFGHATFGELVDGWADPKRGIWSMLAFAMQMCLILVTGYAVAGTAPIQWLIVRIAGIPRTMPQAAALVALGAMGLALLNWGLGLIGGALLAREVGLAMRDQGKPVHYPILGAAGYTGLAIWHGGLSGSAPLKVSEAKDLVEVLGPELAERVGTMPLTRTVLSPANLAVTLGVLIVVPVVLAMLVPRDPARFEPPPPRPPAPAPREGSPGLAGILEEGPWVVVPVVLLIGVWAWRWASAGGLYGLDPNEVNLIFLAAGMALAVTPSRYAGLSEEAARACAGIIVQFPLYGGIVGVLVTSGLLVDLAAMLPHDEQLPMATLLSAALLNLFIPSGGGQWTVQGPIVMQASVDAGVDPAKVVMALAYGDQWTNLLQPFWALPLLGITGARAGDVLGYTAVVCVAIGPVFALGVWLG
jgi:short-chain fatty acids transporter